MTDRIDELLAAAAVEHLGEDAGLGSITAWVNLHRTAPDLLAALQALLHETELAGNANADDYGWPTVVPQARIAINKACGITA